MHAPRPQSTTAMRHAVKTMALFEASKGLLALFALLGLLSLLHHDLHQLALAWMGHLHLSPEHTLGAEVLHGVDHLAATPPGTMIALGCAYIVARWIEAWGLWHDTAWGEWFAVATGGLYLPFEVAHLLAHPKWQNLVVCLLNLGLVVVLLVRLWQRRRTAQT